MFDERSVGRHQKCPSVRQIWDRELKPLAPQLRQVLDLGLGDGASTAWILEHIRPDWYFGVDDWQPPRPHLLGEYTDRRHKCLAAILPFAELRNFECAEHILATDHESLVPLPHSASVAICEPTVYLRDRIRQDYSGVMFDAVFINTGHYGPAVMRQAVLAYDVLKVGGLMLFNEYNCRWHHGKPHVREGANGFAMGFENLMTLYREFDRQLWLQKVA